MVQEGLYVASPQLSCDTLQTKLHFLSFLEVSESEHISVGSHSHFSKILPDVTDAWFFFSFAGRSSCVKSLAMEHRENEAQSD